MKRTHSLLIALVTLVSCHALAGVIDGKPTFVGCNSYDSQCYLYLKVPPTDTGCVHDDYFSWSVEKGASSQILELAKEALIQYPLELRVFYSGCLNSGVAITRLYLKQAPLQQSSMTKTASPTNEP